MKEVLNKLLSIQMTLDTIPVTGRDMWRTCWDVCRR